MKKIAVFKIEYRKRKSKKGKVTTKKVYYFITEYNIASTIDMINIYKTYSLFNNYYVCEKDERGYYFFNSNKKRKELVIVPGIEQY